MVRSKKVGNIVQNLVINRVRDLGRRLHTPTQFFGEFPLGWKVRLTKFLKYRRGESVGPGYCKMYHSVGGNSEINKRRRQAIQFENLIIFLKETQAKRRLLFNIPKNHKLLKVLETSLLFLLEVLRLSLGRLLEQVWVFPQHHCIYSIKM